jgi:hypothetical protein
MGIRIQQIAARRTAWMLALGVVLVVVFSGAGVNRSPARAANPPGPVTLAVPATGVGTASTSWTGTVPAGTTADALRCVDFDPVLTTLTDTFLLQLTGVSDNFYLTHRVRLIVRITWTPATGSYDVNDLGLTTYLRDANGNLTNFQDSHQLGSNSEQVTYSNPLPATGTSIDGQPVAYHVSTCADKSFSLAQSYQGTATLISGLITSSSNVQPGAQTFNNYDFPINYQSRDLLFRPNAGEPNIDANWVSGNTMYASGTQVTRLTWDDTKSPPAATFTDVTPAQQKQVNEDAILTIDHHTNRTHLAGLLIAGANVSLSPDDGVTWLQGASPVPHGPDHETINGGPYHQQTPPLAGLGYPDAVYYCSQNIVQAAGAFCSRSDNGGLTWNPSMPVFVGSDCGAIHGHVKVGPDGTVYLPQRACGAGQGMAVSFDNGVHWPIERVPDSSTIGLNSSDPSVAPAPDGKTVYYAYQDGFGNTEVAVSSDHGIDNTWSPSTNVSAPFAIKNSKFPEIVVGDTDRAAVTFLGTTTAGDDQSNTFTGTWYLYVAFTYDRGKTWTTVNATPNDPVQRGCIWMSGGSNSCRNMLDFNEITVDGHGRVEAAYTDGCTDKCVTNNTINASGCNGSENASYTSTPTCTYGRLSALVRQQCGLGLFSAFDRETLQRCGGGGGGGGGCHEADGSGNFAGPQGKQANFQSDEDSCEDHDQNGEQFKDPGNSEDFHSTQVQSVRFDDSLGLVSISGLGISNGVPVTFLIVEQAATATAPAFYSIYLSDGYALVGNLLSGSIGLQ